jgi:hypothetical protein
MSDTPDALATEQQAPAQVATVIEKYIALRDKKSALKSAYELKARAIDEAQDRCEAYLMGQLKALGAESLRTDFGTAYRTTRTSATVADWELTLNFVREKEMWPLLEKRVNKTFVQSYIDQNADLPPGINWREEHIINIRR